MGFDSDDSDDADGEFSGATDVLGLDAIEVSVGVGVDGKTGELGGSIVDDASGEGIAGATIVATIGDVSQRTTTTADGSFLFRGLPTGLAELRVEAENFEALASFSTTVFAGANAAGLDLELSSNQGPPQSGEGGGEDTGCAAGNGGAGPWGPDAVILLATILILGSIPRKRYRA